MWGRRKLLPQFCTSCIFIKNFSSNSHIPNFKRCKYLASKFFSLNETLSSIKVVLIWGLSPKHRLHSLVPRPSYHPVFDRLQCAKTRLEGFPHQKNKLEARSRSFSPKRWSFEHLQNEKRTAFGSKQRTCVTCALLIGDSSPPQST